MNPRQRAYAFYSLLLLFLGMVSCVPGGGGTSRPGQQSVLIHSANGAITQSTDAGPSGRSWVGGWVEDVTPEVAARYGLQRATGVVITRVDEGGAAQQAALNRPENFGGSVV